MPALQRHHTPDRLPSIPHGAGVRDVSGATIFSTGDLGTAHAMAHRMLDAGDFERGYAVLGSWLDGRAGAGSEWLHLQFHMAVLELELGMWDAAFERYVEHLAPAAASTSLALTDAPAIAWRLGLAAGDLDAVPWDGVRCAATRRLTHRDEPYVELHHVLAFAGAGDHGGLERWLVSRGRRARTASDRLVVRFGRAMRAQAAGEVAAAATGLAEVVPFVSVIGGSRAQNLLFEAIADAATRRHAAVGPGLTAAA